MGKKEHIGKCHICGTYGPLTFEHIPPKGAFNDQPARIITGDDLVNHIANDKQSPWDYTGVKYKQLQKGTGMYSLCQSCNNLTGTLYGSEFIKFVNTIEMLYEENEWEDTISFGMNKVKILNIIKQIMSCFCSTCTAVISYYPTIKEYILNKEQNKFEYKRFNLYMFVLKNPQIYWSGQNVMLMGNKLINIAEIDLGRIGFIVDFGSETKLEDLTDITDLCFNYEYDKEYDLKMTLKIVEHNMYFPMDFRTKEEVLND